ncbi:MAG: hypothetical protein KDA92_00065 [Planctomycetales bacterium]|nr:hypothetical protein [Planctomycetales bacterium]MCA9166020.1 hypothetical protein [Planctomycetales bacterium]
MTTPIQPGFLADGCKRAQAAFEASIREEVEHQYADKLATASIVKRWTLTREIEKQIAERLAQVAPPEALY